jgi:hypothetical protein
MLNTPKILRTVKVICNRPAFYSLIQEPDREESGMQKSIEHSDEPEAGELAHSKI